MTDSDSADLPSLPEATYALDESSNVSASKEGRSAVVWTFGLAFVMSLAALFLLGPAIREIFPESKRFVPVGKSAAPSEWLLFQVMEGMTYLWFFMLGGSFGSFLHCLEYRQPRGISIAASGSRCPGCGTKIRWLHNLPMLGWLTLEGRCATCSWPIPARYAITEMIFAWVFVALAAMELGAAGANLPLHLPNWHVGLSWTVWSPQWDLIGYYASHTALVAILMTTSLFAADRFRVPHGLVAIGLILGIALPMAWPVWQPVGWDGRVVAAPLDTARWHAAAGIILGALEGLLLAFVMMRRQAGNVRYGDGWNLAAGLLLVGVFLGWQATIGVALIATGTRAIASLAPLGSALRRAPLVLHLTVAAFFHLMAWRWLGVSDLWPGRPGQTLATTIAVVLVVILSRLLDMAERGGDADRGDDHSNWTNPVIAALPETEPATSSLPTVDTNAPLDQSSPESHLPE